MIQLQFVGRGRLLENGRQVLPGEKFETTEKRAAELLTDPHANVRVAQDEYQALTREELNQLAERAGVEHPEALPNKQAVIDVLTDPVIDVLTDSEAEADTGEGQSPTTPDQEEAS